MTAFWIVAAFFIAGALLFMLPPLLGRGGRKAKLARADITVSIYRDELAELEVDLQNGVIPRDQYQQARKELERRLLEDMSSEGGAPAKALPPRAARMAGIAMGVAVPLLAVGLYLHLGNPKAITEAGKAAVESPHAGGQMSPQQIQAMVEALAARLEQNPKDPDGWAMLARSYTTTGRFQEAARAWGKVNELLPDNPQVLADYADVLAMAQGRRLAGAPVNLIEQALKADPNHPKSLALAGSAAFEVKDYGKAVAYWERLLKLLQPDSESYRSVSSGIAEAKALAGGAAPQAAAQPATDRAASPGATGAASISGKVTLGPAVKAKAAPGDTLFIFARAVQGPKMPVAIARLQVKDFPLSFTLDDSSAMGPAMKLSLFPEVVVGARISKSGNATPQSGDLEGFTSPVKVGSSGIQVVIDKVVP
ncbi:MAG TPA: c-type cytochrome biogenesis protein CcmI [Burkholderiales bacterium]|nr:c-type cytochrome biogenesis protein CcmI [Burkholderiales bacterium]